MLDFAKVSSCPRSFFVDFLWEWRQTVAWNTYDIASVDTAALRSLLEETLCPVCVCTRMCAYVCVHLCTFMHALVCVCLESCIQWYMWGYVDNLRELFLSRIELRKAGLATSIKTHQAMPSAWVSCFLHGLFSLPSCLFPFLLGMHVPLHCVFTQPSLPGEHLGTVVTSFFLSFLTCVLGHSGRSLLQLTSLNLCYATIFCLFTDFPGGGGM